MMSKERAHALAAGEDTFMGHDCKDNHGGERHTICERCVECDEAIGRARARRGRVYLIQIIGRFHI